MLYSLIAKVFTLSSAQRHRLFCVCALLEKKQTGHNWKSDKIHFRLLPVIDKHLLVILTITESII